MMDDSQRLQLQKMISENNVSDNTDLIRQLKHSHVLRDDVNRLVMLKAKNMGDDDALHLEAMGECGFLFTYYTDIYNKIRKDEMDLKVLFEALDVLRDIEEGKLDQHEGSYAFGMLLKKLYVDSAIKKADKINSQYEDKEPEYKGAQVNISWKQYKRNMN